MRGWPGVVVMDRTLPTTTDVAGRCGAGLWRTAAGRSPVCRSRDRRRRAVRCGRARPGLGPPPGPGRVLRRGRAARQAVPARQARRRGRHRRSRRGGHGVVRGEEVRRALGDVDARGPLPVPARGVPHRPVPRLPRRQHGGDGPAARGLAAGGAAVAGRGVRRPREGRPARPGDRDGDRAGRADPGRRARGDRRPDRLGRPRAPRSSSPRSPPTSTSPTAWSWWSPAPSRTCSGPCTSR